MKTVRFIISFFVLSLMSGCSSDDEVSDNVSTCSSQVDLWISGTVYDSETIKPVKGICVVLTSFIGGEGEVVITSRDSVLSASSGSYVVNVPAASFDYRYSLAAYDLDGGENGGPYTNAYMEVYINEESPSYDVGNATYTLSDNNFFLEKQ